MAEYDKIIAIDLDESTGIHLSAEVEDEQKRAIADLLAVNEFRPLIDSSEVGGGPYKIKLKSLDHKLVIEIVDQKQNNCSVIVGLQPFKRIMKDYQMVCDSYYKAVKQATVHKIEALDMGRRGLHDEGALLLQDTLEDKIDCDFATARRLFTLMYVLFSPTLR